jgi:hypothetical protein
MQQHPVNKTTTTTTTTATAATAATATTTATTTTNTPIIVIIITIVNVAVSYLGVNARINFLQRYPDQCWGQVTQGSGQLAAFSHVIPGQRHVVILIILTERQSTIHQLLFQVNVASRLCISRLLGIFC